MATSRRKDLFWAGSSKKDYAEFPREVQDDLGYALDLVQAGVKVIAAAKPLAEGKLKGLGILELRDNHDSDTYRAIYTTKIGNVVYVLHAFKKKSKSGIATPQAEVDLILTRYQAALKHHAEAVARAKTGPEPSRIPGKKKRR
jgi:phage-related protein